LEVRAPVAMLWPTGTSCGCGDAIPLPRLAPASLGFRGSRWSHALWLVPRGALFRP